MARAQIYRGDPELKQVVLFDNFSGGMNTTDIDEQMGANEFRYLENVELMEQGRVGKRTGFGNLGIEYVSGMKHFGLPVEGDIYHISVLYDDYNNFSEYNYDEFKEEETIHNIALAVIHYDQNEEEVLISTITLKGRGEDDDYSIEVENEYSRFLADAERWDLVSNREGFKITGLNINYYDGRAYFMLNQIVENSEEIVSYWYEDNELKVKTYDKDNSYRPTPFELTNVGFNTFSKLPHSHTSAAGTSSQSIQSVIILSADDDNLVLDKIPLSGKFRIRVYYTGTDFVINEDDIRFYIPDLTEEKGKKYIQSDIEKIPTGDTGYFDYTVTLNTSSIADVNIEVVKETHKDPNEDRLYDKAFESTDEMISFYQNKGKLLMSTSTQSTATIYGPEEGSWYGYEIAKLKAYGRTTLSGESVRVYLEQEIEDVPIIGGPFSNGLEEPKYYSTGRGIKAEQVVNSLKGKAKLYRESDDYLISGVSDGFALAKYTYDYPMLNLFTPVRLPVDGEFGYGHEEYDHIIYGNSDFENFVDEPPKIENLYLSTDFLKGDILYPYADYIANTERVIMIDNGVDKVKFYRYNGGNDGDVRDFTEYKIELTEEIINFTVRFEIGNTGEKPIEELKFNNLKAIIIKDRLVLYGGNTVVYSDIYNRQQDGEKNIQGFTYFPNYNWFSLALGANDSIQKIAYFRGSYMIFTKTSIYRMSGDFHTDEFTITLVSDVVGCVSPDSIRSMNNTLIFLSEDGLYTLKQNYYLDGMENVGKIDSNIQGVIPYGENYESIIYNEQYWLFIKDRNGKLIKVLKQYYNLNLPKGQHPYTIDVYNEGHFYLFRDGIDIYGVKDKELFRRDNKYTDFKPKGEKSFDYNYNVKIETPYWSFGYPLHEKKFKNVFLKVNSIRELPIIFDVLVDFGAAVSSDHYSTRINSYGEVEYTFERKPTFVTEGVGELNSMKLGKAALGDAVYQVHKINPATKGKTIKFKFEQGSSSEFSVDAISIVYKLGKMRESR